MLGLFLAKRFFKSGSPKADGRRTTSPALRIATTSIAVGLAVMIIAVCTVRGFQREIKQKFSGFASHIELLDLNSFGSPETYPVVTDAALIAEVKAAPHVERVQRVSQKLGIFKTQTDYAGISLKGVGEDYDLTFISGYMVEGKLPPFSSRSSSNEVVVSKTLADQLGLRVGDKVYSYYFANSIKQRRFTVAGIYQTNLKQFDKTVVLTDLHAVNQLNSWADDQSTALEIYLKSFDDIPETEAYLQQKFHGRTDRLARSYSVLSIRRNPVTASVFSWVELLDVNVMVILILMVCISGFTMISGLLILILERTSTIGVLKALGATNSRVRHTFLWYAALIVGRGLLWGNVIGVGLVLLQKHFGIVTLNPEVYYVPVAPVDLNVWWIVGLNVATLLVTMLAMILPSFLVSRIQPAKAIQFD